MSSRVTPEGFRNRLDFLISERDDGSVARIARSQGVTERTVRGWARGRTTPSARTRDNIRRQALRAGAPRAVQFRDDRGRLSITFSRASEVRAIQSAQEGARRQRALALRAAEETGSEEAIRAVELVPVFSERDAIRIAQGLGQLQDTGEADEYPGGWRQWESDYESFVSAGGAL